jgi:hypothetical protein
MFLVDANGRIVHANASGHAMLAQGSLLLVIGGKLAPKDVSAEQALCEVYAMAECGDAAMGAKGISVPLMTPSGERYVAHVLPLTSGARRRRGRPLRRRCRRVRAQGGIEYPLTRLRSSASTTS